MEDIIIAVATLLLAAFTGWVYRGRSEETKRLRSLERKELIEDKVEAQDDQALADRLTRRP